MDADIGEEVDPAMANLTNRLPFMDLEELCKENNYSFAIGALAAASPPQATASI